MSKYVIADLKIEIDTFGRTLKQLMPYKMDYEGISDGVICAQHRTDNTSFLSDDEHEYIFTGFRFSELLLHKGGLILHSSAVEMNGEVFCFSADSGVGKSTHAQLYRQYFGKECVQIINDDKPALRCINGVWRVYGTPWCGKTDLNVNINMPLAGICFLERGEKNTIVRLSVGEAVKLLIRQNPFPTIPVLRYKWISALDELLKHIPVWKMTCNMSPEAAAISYAAMSGKDVLQC